MKLLLFLCLVFAANGINAYVTELTEILKLTHKVHQYVTECANEFGEGNEVKKEAVRSILRSGEGEEDKKVEKVTRCFFHKAGILQPDGTLNNDAAKSILTLIGMDKTEAEELLSKCTSIVGYDAGDMAYAIFKCFEEGFKG